MTTGAGTAVNLLATVATTKLFAVLLGTQGIGLFSVIKQANQTFSMLACFGGMQAIIQGMNAKPADERNRYIVSCILFMLLFGMSISLLIVISKSQLAFWLFGDESKKILIYALAFTVWLSVGVCVGKALLNGHLAIGQLALVTAFGGIGFAAAAYPAATLVDDYFVLPLMLPIIASALCSIVTAFFFLNRNQHLKPLWDQEKRITYDDMNHFLSISAPLLLGGFVGIAVMLIVRVTIVQNDGLASAGIFAAAWALGVVYINLMVGTLTVYHLPTLSASCSMENSSLLMDRMLRVSIILLLPLVIFATVNKAWLISLFYSEHFFASAEILRWLLLATYFQITNRVFGTQLIASANMRTFTIVNISFHLLYMIAVIFLLRHGYALEWLGAAFLCMIVMNMCFIVPYVMRHYGIKISSILFLRWLFGLVSIIICSGLTWSQPLSTTSSSLLCFFSFIVMAFMLSNEEKKAGVLWLRKKIF